MVVKETNKPKEEIIQEIQKMSGRYSPDIIFSDWVKCTAIAIQNACSLLSDKVWQSREEQYISTMKKYTSEEQKSMSKMMVLLAEALEESMTDVLGEIYMESGCGSRQTGQFFTPFHVSKLVSEMQLGRLQEGKSITIIEPSSGGGGMIIAAAKTIKDRGINYQRYMKVTAQDLDWRSVYMSYIQLSLLGIDARVIQGNTLSEAYVQGNYPKECIFRTPRNMGVLI